MKATHSLERIQPLPLAEDDHTLMQRIGEGDADAYRQLVMRHAPVALRVAMRIVGNRADAEDVVQDVFAKLWRDSAGFKPQAKFTTWLYRVVFNACIDQKRRQRRMLNADDALEHMADDRLLADAALMEHEEAVRVKQAMRHLPERQKAALALCYYEGLSNAEAAESLGVSLNLLQTTLFRARQKLKELLKDQANG